MAYDKAVDSEALDTALTYTADRIRNKSGGTAQIPWDSAKGFGDAVDGIETGILPTGTIDITANGTYDVADKATANVNVESGVDYLEQRISGKLTSYSNDAVDALNQYAFAFCSKLASLSTPAVSSIGMQALRATAITKYVSTAETLTIGNSAFQDCNKLTIFDASGQVKFQLYSLNNCTALQAVILRGQTASLLLANTVFSGSSVSTGTGYIYVPAAMVDAYKSATNWSAYADQIRAIEDYPEITGG